MNSFSLCSDCTHFHELKPRDIVWGALYASCGGDWVEHKREIVSWVQLSGCSCLVVWNACWLLWRWPIQRDGAPSPYTSCTLAEHIWDKIWGMRLSLLLVPNVTLSPSISQPHRILHWPQWVWRIFKTQTFPTLRSLGSHDNMTSVGIPTCSDIVPLLQAATISFYTVMWLM